MLDEVLSLNGRSAAFTAQTPLLGAVRNSNSMAVVTLITTLEERFGITINNDDIEGATFATVGSLRLRRRQADRPDPQVLGMA